MSNKLPVLDVIDSGISRRQILKSASGGFGYLALASMLGQNSTKVLAGAGDRQDAPAF